MQPTQNRLVVRVWALNQVASVVLYCILYGSKGTQPVCPRTLTLVCVACILFFEQLHTDKKQISVGFIGYPNVGKSSVINTLRSKKVCNVAPIAGETKVHLAQGVLFTLTYFPRRVVIQDTDMSVCLSRMKISAGSLASLSQVVMSWSCVCPFDKTKSTLCATACFWHGLLCAT